jgi:hypothetical protein
MYGHEYFSQLKLEAAGNIDIMKKIKYLIPTTCLSDVHVFEAKS